MRKTATIKLKDEYTDPRELTIGNVTVRLAPGAGVRVPIGVVNAFLRKPFVELADGETDEDPVELSPVELLEKEHSKDGLLELARAAGIDEADTKGLKKRELAELIVKKSEEN